MNWNSQDNKHYRGPIDRVFVSQTEQYEVDYFIDQYLSTRNFALTDDNRKKVGQKMQGYPGHAPVKRSDLEAFLDKGWKT